MASSRTARRALAPDRKGRRARRQTEKNDWPLRQTGRLNEQRRQAKQAGPAALLPGRTPLALGSAHRHGIVARGFDQGSFEQRYLVLREREQGILVAILQIDLLDHGGAAPA